MIDIIRQCPICNDTIVIKSARDIPKDIVYIKTKRHSVVLVHKDCIEKEKIANENKQVK